MLPTNSKSRKEHPIARGVLDYFPDAIAAVAHVSHVGNEQHNPGQPMHWAREKSSDHADCIARHLIERGTADTDGLLHSAKVAWRALAMLQIELEALAEVDKAGNGGILQSPDLVSSPQTAREVQMISGIISDATYFVAPCAADQAVPDRAGPAALEMRLCTAGCPSEVAENILGGLTLPEDADQEAARFVYLSGPMRGYPHLNFGSFYEARSLFLSLGWNVVSPADVDRVAGDSAENDELTEADSRRFAMRDFYALHALRGECGDAIAMLPGWEMSVGAMAEFFMAGWLGLQVLDAKTGLPLNTLICHHVVNTAYRHLEG